MAASSMSARSLTRIARFSRSLIFSRPNGRPCLHEMSTAATENKVSTDKASVNSETLKTAPEKESNGASSKEETKPDAALEKLMTENKKLQEDLDAVKDKYMRALAETENVRSRLMKQVQEAKLFGIQGFCKDLLEIADILNQATETVPKEELAKNQHLKSLFEGLKMTNTQLEKVFGKHGLSKIEPAVGEKFDPFFHEALFQVPVQGDNKADTVAVIQKTGYKLQDRTLRPALVGVFK